MARVCHHRGIGKENTIEAISSAIQVSPFIVEFDVQLEKSKLNLGHPPDLGKNTVVEALELFKNNRLLPKIDLKLTSKSFDEALSLLVDVLTAWAPRKALVNISGDLNANQYMQAEQLLMSKTGDATLLNIDLGRYGANDRDEIIGHIRGLERVPFSISPNLDDDIATAIDIAKIVGIPHLHFWSTFDKHYSTTYLYSQMKLCQGNGLEVYFDIKDSNVIRD